MPHTDEEQEQGKPPTLVHRESGYLEGGTHVVWKPGSKAVVKRLDIRKRQENLQRRLSIIQQMLKEPGQRMRYSQHPHLIPTVEQVEATVENTAENQMSAGDESTSNPPITPTDSRHGATPESGDDTAQSTAVSDANILQQEEHGIFGRSTEIEPIPEEIELVTIDS